MRLRPAWREAKQAGSSRAGGSGRGADGEQRGGGRRPGGRPGARVARDKGSSNGQAGVRGAGLPSRTRVLANILVGLVVTVASLAALIARG